MSADAWRAYAKGIARQMQSGQLSLPAALFSHYKRLQLTDIEVMLLIHLLDFKQNECKDFPTIDEIQARMSSTETVVISALQRLMKEGFLSIDEHIDPITRVQGECYNLEGIWEKLAVVLAEDIREERQRQRQQHGNRAEENTPNLFDIFEKEFGRPLSPMECETIAGWIDDDHYSEPIILMALKEAVFAGKVHFRYIDRILLEWSRNKIRTVEDARNFTQKFRGNGRS
ncbi:DnaD domain-containing protein [Paenibacillus arenosi]|uniref:DnaD domain-containing protein n=1 Tax=Paenibacillus arenosi TaxID=2774142 RepID=A0ABR9AV32_9BACL|nr:DnaD domain-containing protein [Paenibacillus arenosi]MBD8497573.1 DnaD domain-containing protein [Paenibacillus arenosi]